MPRRLERGSVARRSGDLQTPYGNQRSDVKEISKKIHGSTSKCPMYDDDENNLSLTSESLFFSRQKKLLDLREINNLLHDSKFE